ncbi:MAG: hypothetical protein ABGW82_02375, partial [Paracoccus sp. (in: a-proteobacteria)]
WGSVDSLQGDKTGQLARLAARNSALPTDPHPRLLQPHALERLDECALNGFGLEIPLRNNIYIYGIRGEGKSATHRAHAFMADKRFDATRIHTHTFDMEDLPEALRYARERVEDAIKVVVKNRH